MIIAIFSLSKKNTACNCINSSLIGCFVDACDPDKIPAGSNTTDICKINKNIINLQNSTENLQICLNQNDLNGTDPCKVCLNSFKDIQNHYNQVHSAPNGACFEAVDQVNLITKLQ